MDVLTLETRRSDSRYDNYKARDAMNKLAAKRRPPVVLFDTMQEANLPAIGRLIAGQRASGGQLFCAGSSGVEYALVAHWHETGDAYLFRG